MVRPRRREPILSERLLSNVKSKYSENGWLVSEQRIYPGLLAQLSASVARISEVSRPETVRERDGVTVRALHGCHRYDETCARLVRLPELVDLAETLIDDQVYVYQFKINIKNPLEGKEWPWHQDFAFWSVEDGMPASGGAVNIAINCDVVHEGNGPLTVLSGTHRLGLLPESESEAPAFKGRAWQEHVSAELPHAVSDRAVEALLTEYPVERLTGPAGTITAFHPSIVHSSSNNYSNDRRAVLYITYNSVHNVPRHAYRPAFLVDPDSTPITRLVGPL